MKFEITKELLIMLINKTIFDWSSPKEKAEPDHIKLRDEYVKEIITVLEKAKEI
jgi:hypothetical protein